MKYQHVALIFVALASAFACTRNSPEQQLVVDAARALGGRDKILAIQTITIEGEAYIVVAISKNEVVFSAKSNNKKTPRPFTPAP